MTTSMPQFGRAALFCRHAGGTCPLRGPWLIGLPRINRRLWAAVSRRITFAAAPAHVSNRHGPAAVESRRNLCWPSSIQDFFRRRSFGQIQARPTRGSCFDIGKGWIIPCLILASEPTRPWFAGVESAHL